MRLFHVVGEVEQAIKIMFSLNRIVQLTHCSKQALHKSNYRPERTFIGGAYDTNGPFLDPKGKDYVIRTKNHIVLISLMVNDKRVKKVSVDPSFIILARLGSEYLLIRNRRALLRFSISDMWKQPGTALPEPCRKGVLPFPDVGALGGVSVRGISTDGQFFLLSLDVRYLNALVRTKDLGCIWVQSDVPSIPILAPKIRVLYELPIVINNNEMASYRLEVDRMKKMREERVVPIGGGNIAPVYDRNRVHMSRSGHWIVAIAQHQGDQQRVKYDCCLLNLGVDDPMSCSQCNQGIPEGGSGFPGCASCMKVFYCGESCQLAHWEAVHKRACKTDEVTAIRLPEISTPSALVEPTSSRIFVGSSGDGLLCVLAYMVGKKKMQIVAYDRTGVQMWKKVYTETHADSLSMIGKDRSYLAIVYLEKLKDMYRAKLVVVDVRLGQEVFEEVIGGMEPDIRTVKERKMMEVAVHESIQNVVVDTQGEVIVISTGIRQFVYSTFIVELPCSIDVYSLGTVVMDYDDDEDLDEAPNENKM